MASVGKKQALNISVYALLVRVKPVRGIYLLSGAGRVAGQRSTYGKRKILCRFARFPIKSSAVAKKYSPISRRFKARPLPVSYRSEPTVRLTRFDVWLRGTRPVSRPKVVAGYIVGLINYYRNYSRSNYPDKGRVHGR